MGIAQLLANNQAQTNTFVIHFLHIFKFSKLLEESFLISLTNADSCVLNLHHDLVLFLQVAGIDLDEAIFACKFKSILDKVYQHLL
jgi:hypothetical protein